MFQNTGAGCGDSRGRLPPSTPVFVVSQWATVSAGFRTRWTIDLSLCILLTCLMVLLLAMLLNKVTYNLFRGAMWNVYLELFSLVSGKGTNLRETKQIF